MACVIVCDEFSVAKIKVEMRYFTVVSSTPNTGLVGYSHVTKQSWFCMVWLLIKLLDLRISFQASKQGLHKIV